MDWNRIVDTRANASANAAYLAQQHIDYLVEKGELAHRVEIYGGAGTCLGMNPDAIRIALQYPNFKMIWFPTFTSLGFWRGAGHPEKGGVRLVSDSGEVLPEVVQIMENRCSNQSLLAAAISLKLPPTESE